MATVEVHDLIPVSLFGHDHIYAPGWCRVHNDVARRDEGGIVECVFGAGFRRSFECEFVAGRLELPIGTIARVSLDSEAES